MKLHYLIFFFGMALATQYFSMDGILADPCANELKNQADTNTDCSQVPYMVPAVSATYQVPFFPWTQNFDFTKVPLIIQGRFFGLYNGTIGLAYPGKDCAAANAGTTAENQIFGSSTIYSATATAASTLKSIPATYVDSSRTALKFDLSTVSSFFTDPTNYTATSANRYSIDAAQLFISERSPRKICFNPYDSTATSTKWEWTGLYIKAVFSCQPQTSQQTATWCVNKPDMVFTSEYDDAVYRGLTQCCTGTTQQQFKTAMCINPNTQSCCGSKAVSQSYQKCCNESVESIQWIDGSCPCKAFSTYGPTHQYAGRNYSYCPSGEICCLPTKYAELIPSDLSTYNKIGTCYNPRISRCCDTGDVYDPGANQCCSISGLQSINTPCLCSSNADCVGGQVGYRFLDFECCIQSAPPAAPSTASCNKYTNFPSGNGNVASCAGTCIDKRYQMCCNGQNCLRNSERCCNATCCNRYDETCEIAAVARGSFRNYMEYNMAYSVCTYVENIDLLRAWWMFVLPTWCLVWTLAGLALALVFAGRVERQALKALEKGMILCALIAALFACCLYFAPLYKYGLVIVFVSIFTILTAATRKVGMYIACIGLHIILIIYLIDPFHGNDYLTLAIDRIKWDGLLLPDVSPPAVPGVLNPVAKPNGWLLGRPDPYSAGLWHSTSRIWDVPDSCHDFYNGYFTFDIAAGIGYAGTSPTAASNYGGNLQRLREPSNPSFGYCSRGWVSAMLVFDGFIIIAVIVNFFLTLIALLLRARMLKQAEEVVWQP